METIGEMFNFSSSLWFDKRWINKKTSEASLYLQVVIDRKHKEFKLKLKWPVAFIDLAKGVLLPRFKNDREVADYNLIIDSERAKYTEVQRTFRLRNEPLDMERFSREVRTMDQRECFTTYIERERQRRYSRKEIEHKTFQNAHAAMMQLMEYDKLCLFKNINKKWMQGFKNFLIKKKYAPGTVWDRIKIAKTYLALAAEEPMIYVNPEAIAFSNPLPETSTTYLNTDEVRKLLILDRAANLTDTEQKVLKAFLFTCFTSLRISDVYRVNSKWEMGEDWLEFIPKKNEKKQRKLKIPVIPIAKQFISVNTLTYFVLPTEQEYNRTLKDLAERANIPKKLTSHVGRHTFGYLFMTYVGNIYGLQEILGHKNLRTTERYAHLDEDYKKASVLKIQDDFDDFKIRRIS